jgi:alkylation response protein AidB-like acyl-CoA dehydrogenase
MDFSFDPDEVELAAALRSALAAELPPDRLRAAAADPAVRADVWARLAEQGLFGLLVAASCGGLGLGWTAAVPALQELGRAAAPGPYVDAVAVAPVLLAALRTPEADKLLGDVAAGAAVVGVAFDGVAFDRGLVACAADLDVVLLVVGDEIVGVPADELGWTVTAGLDEAMPLSRVGAWDRSGDAVVRGRIDADALAVARAGGALATAAQLVGAAQRMLDITRDHVVQREQFGRPIGSFQAVQHALVDAALGVAFAEPVVHAAAWELQQQSENAVMAASKAKHAAARAARVTSRVALQLHGAIGYTLEYDLQIWMKRVLTLTRMHGGAEWHRTRLVDALVSR